MPTYTAVIDRCMILVAVGPDVLPPPQGGLTQLRYRGHETWFGSCRPRDRVAEGALIRLIAKIVVYLFDKQSGSYSHDKNNYAGDIL